MLVDCEDCGKPTEETMLRKAMDSSDGNNYLMCSKCRKHHSKVFEDELNEDFGDE